MASITHRETTGTMCIHTHTKNSAETTHKDVAGGKEARIFNLALTFLPIFNIIMIFCAMMTGGDGVGGWHAYNAMNGLI